MRDSTLDEDASVDAAQHDGTHFPSPPLPVLCPCLFTNGRGKAPLGQRARRRGSRRRSRRRSPRALRRPPPSGYGGRARRGREMKAFVILPKDDEALAILSHLRISERLEYRSRSAREHGWLPEKTFPPTPPPAAPPPRSVGAGQGGAPGGAPRPIRCHASRNERYLSAGPASGTRGRGVMKLGAVSGS
jgi:hypothetical protein